MKEVRSRGHETHAKDVILVLMWFNSTDSLLHVLVAGIAVYVFLVIFLRVSGKRTLSQLNAFDFVVTVAFGSTLASTILDTDISIVDGTAALFLLIALQFAVARLTVVSSWFQRVVKSRPRLLYHESRFLEQAMKQERINRDEILQAARSQGIASMDQVEAVVLETNGNMSILRKSKPGTSSTLENVRRL
jgi:uncharacterized membrane protein YcaP (DUF421 family)